MVMKNIQVHDVVISGNLQVKNLKIDVSTTPRQNSPPSSYHHPQDRDKILILPVKSEDYENLFQNVLL